MNEALMLAAGALLLCFFALHRIAATLGQILTLMERWDKKGMRSWTGTVPD